MGNHFTGATHTRQEGGTGISARLSPGISVSGVSGDHGEDVQPHVGKGPRQGGEG